MRPTAYTSLCACVLGFATFSACGQVIGLGPERNLDASDAAVDDAGSDADASDGDDAGDAAGATDASDSSDAGDVGDADASDADGSGDSGQNPCTGAVLWAKRFGDASSQYATSIVPDGSGGVYIAGYFEGALDLGGTPVLISNGGTDIFLARLDGDGNHLWSHRFGGTGAQNGVLSLTPVPNGLILAGELRGSADFGGGIEHVSTGLSDGFVAKFDSAGTFEWNRFVAGSQNEIVTNVAVDGSGALYLGVVFVDTVTYMNKTYTSEGMKDILVSKLDPGPVEAWTLQFGDTGDEAPNWIGVNATDTAIMGGTAASSLSIGQGVLPATDSWDVVIGTYDSTNGSAITTKRFGGAGHTDVSRVVSYPFTNDLLVTGRLRFNATLDLGDGQLSSLEGAFLGRLHANLGPVASRAIDNFLVPDAVAVDSAGNVFVGGTFTSVANFDAQPIATNGLKDAVLMKLDSMLDTTWVLQLGSVGDDELHGVSIDPVTGAGFAFGNFSQTLSFEGGIATCADLTSAGGTDLMLIKLAP